MVADRGRRRSLPWRCSLRPPFAAFPGANGKIAVYGCAGSRVDVFTLEPSGADLTNLTNTQQSAEYDPVWSADGKRIAFADLVNGRIWVMNADASDRRAITTDLPGESARDVDPAWSPDGRQIVFSRSLGGGCFFCNDRRLFVVGLDGSPPHRLTSGSSHEDEPSWSPDGTEIAFSRLEGCVGFRCVVQRLCDRSRRQRRTAGDRQRGSQPERELVAGRPAADAELDFGRLLRRRDLRDGPRWQRHDEAHVSQSTVSSSRSSPPGPPTVPGSSSSGTQRGHAAASNAPATRSSASSPTGPTDAS